MELVNERIARQMIEGTEGRIFHAEFLKRDETVRQMSGRLGVTEYLKGGELGYNAGKKHLIVVFDMEKQEYRTIPVKRLLSLTIDGKRYHVSHNMGKRISQ